MKTAMPAMNKSQACAFCPVCGRASGGSSRGECGGCTSMFELGAGQGLYSPLTGKLWFRAQGNGTLVSPSQKMKRGSGTISTGVNGHAMRVSWLILLGVAAVILNGCLQLLW